MTTSRKKNEAELILNFIIYSWPCVYLSVGTCLSIHKPSNFSIKIWYITLQTTGNRHVWIFLDVYVPLLCSLSFWDGDDEDDIMWKCTYCHWFGLVLIPQSCDPWANNLTHCDVDIPLKSYRRGPQPNSTWMANTYHRWCFLWELRLVK